LPQHRTHMCVFVHGVEQAWATVLWCVVFTCSILYCISLCLLVLYCSELCLLHLT
jgi:hypothetical protein